MIITPIFMSAFYTTEVIAPVYILVSSGVIVYRKRISGSRYYIDFSEDNGVSWELALVDMAADESSIIILVDSSPVGFRQVVRGRDYCIDEELTPTGFAGTEGVDWENIYMIEK